MAECLAWGPVHVPSSQQMHVEVIDSLASVWAGVDDETKTVVEMLLLCNFSCGVE